MNKFFYPIILLGISFMISGWGFFAHERINRLATFTLPPEMIGFYKKNISYITETSVNPDRRRFSMPEEAPRHYVDIDHYGDSALYKLPRFWNEAVEKYSEDTLMSYGIVPWHINRMYFQLKDAFMLRDPERILKISAELGHYIADGHVPLHTTENYNGQLTGQVGIHGFWESRLPELYSDQYDFFVGKAEYLTALQLSVWKGIESAHLEVKSVLTEEKLLAERFGEKKYSFETKGRQTIKVYSREYAHTYHKILNGMVERQMRRAIKMIGDVWYTAWIDAGQPDIKSLIHYKPTEAELERRKKELEEWKKQGLEAAEH